MKELTPQEKNKVIFLENIEGLDLNKKQVSQLAGVHVRTVERWADGSRKVPNNIVILTDIWRMMSMNHHKTWVNMKKEMFKEDGK